MSKIYIGQSKLRLNFDLDADITGYATATVYINVRKPNDSTTTWTATVSDGSSGSIYYDIATSTVLDIAGKWLLQPKIIYTDSTTSYGETTYIIVYNYYE